MLKHEPPVELPEGYVDFFKALESWQNEEVIKHRKLYTPAKHDLKQIITSQKNPLLTQVKPQIDADMLKDLYTRLLDFLLEQRPEIQEVIKNISSQIDQMDFDKISASFIQSDMEYFENLAVQMNVSYDLLFFSIDHAIRPLLRIFAEPYSQDLSDDLFYWEFPAICPVCGSKSHICRLNAGDGQRFMFCDRCFTEWHVRYLYCVYCGNDQAKDIYYLNVENDDAYKLFLCNKCKGYLKTYDGRSLGKSTDLFIANIESVYLDMLAQEKGYTNHDND
ncbi:MAG TPA: formate dehydrogenase accessory protein FdhE [Gelria sp.]|nr:formate dehydrogenase accessory protein FdhE [Gelria sp.]